MAKETTKMEVELSEHHSSDIKLFQMTEDFSEYKALIKGPQDTLYEGGTFELSIQVCEDYPFKPPKIKFVTKIFHPNIGLRSGAICLEELGVLWSPAITIAKLLIWIKGLLREPKDNDHYLVDKDDPITMLMYRNDRVKFNELAKSCTRECAIYNDLCAFKIHLHRDILTSSFCYLHTGMYKEIHKYLNI